MATVTIDKLRKIFPTAAGGHVAIDDVSFQIADRQFTSLVGPSGCGKTTLLNIVSGVESPSGGSVDIHAEGHEARVGYVFQEPRLLPWRSILANMLYVQSSQDDATVERCRNYLELVGLKGAEDKYPAQLSGGMQQRAGIARAFSVEPDLLLMDEPFSHLDAITARSLRAHLQELWLETRKTVMFVTHDVMEAVELSDEIVVLEPGGRLHELIPVTLERPRRASDVDVASLKADILGRFEQLEQQKVVTK